MARGRMVVMTSGSIEGEALIQNSNPVFGVEIRGFDHIPEAERNMTLKQVGLLWLGNNLNLFCIVVGCFAITRGLSLWWALAACVIGNLPYAYVALGSICTVRAGFPVTTLSRAAFGMRGNFPNAFLGWIASVAFEVINTIFGVYALLALFDLIGWRSSHAAGRLVAVLIQLILGGGVAVLGHATMVFLQRILALSLGGVLLVVFAYTCGEVDWVGAGHMSLTPSAFPAAFMTACGVLAFQPISYLFNGPDWVRYLPSQTSARALFSRIFWWTFLPSVVITIMGAMWATLGDMTDPIAGLKPFIPTWLFILYIFAAIGGSLANSIPTFYSSGLTLQAMGLNVKRSTATSVDIVVSTSIVLYILFVRDFSTVLNNFIAILLVWLGPYGGVWICDCLLRRGVYEPGTVHRSEGHRSSEGADHEWAAWIALLTGMCLAILTMKSPVYDGPIARALGGMDLSWIVGFLAAAAIHGGLVVVFRRRSSTPLVQGPGATTPASVPAAAPKTEVQLSVD
jgi:nucleobase:cation symporter-1, NCS1 family